MNKKLSYILGLKLIPRAVICNFKKSDKHIVIASCHPKGAINWKWSLYANKPKSIKWIFNMGLKLYTNKNVYWY